jgi:phosphoacetylglucosamine mutase
VGAIAAKGFMKVLEVVGPQALKINIYSDNIGNDQLLNLNCGADFVKVQQKSPESLPPSLLRRCVSFDGDADRVVYYYTDGDKIFHLLDGDRIATLSKFFDPRLQRKILTYRQKPIKVKVS